MQNQKDLTSILNIDSGDKFYDVISLILYIAKLDNALYGNQVFFKFIAKQIIDTAF